jgi:hypothetical protein
MTHQPGHRAHSCGTFEDLVEKNGQLNELAKEVFELKRLAHYDERYIQH